MPTIAESLQNAANRLDAAVTAVLGLRSDMEVARNAALAQINARVSSFEQRSLTREFFVDPVSGDDTNDGSLAKPFRTLDKAIDSRLSDGFTSVNLLGDCVLSRYHSLYSTLSFAGITRNTPDNSVPFTAASRKLTFANEAANSPSAAFGRLVAGFNQISGNLQLKNINVMLADPSAAVVFPHHILSQGVVSMQSCTIDAPTSGALGRFLYAADGFHADLWFSGSLGPNAPGKVFTGVSAGSNPNTTAGGRYSSNLTSA